MELTTRPTIKPIETNVQPMKTNRKHYFFWLMDYITLPIHELKKLIFGSDFMQKFLFGPGLKKNPREDNISLRQMYNQWRQKELLIFSGSWTVQLTETNI